MIFKSTICQNEGILDLTQLFSDINKFVDEQKVILKVAKLGRTHPLQHILNSTSGKYIAPTSMKSFELCPGSYVYSKLVQEKKGTATSVGRTYHTIMQKWYDGKERTRENIFKIADAQLIEDLQTANKDEIYVYINGYLDGKDYIGRRAMDHQKLICSNEQFIKPVIAPLGVSLGVPIYLLIDRIDIRDEGIFVVDYKTGIGDPNPYLLGEHGYLPQMIFYKWGVEAEYGETIKKAFLALPGASAQYKYTEMNVNSLVEQSKVIEQVSFHLDYASKVRDSLMFPTKLMRYCSSCQLKGSCYTYINSKGGDKSLIKTEISVEVEILDGIYE